MNKDKVSSHVVILLEHTVAWCICVHEGDTSRNWLKVEAFCPFLIYTSLRNRAGGERPARFALLALNRYWLTFSIKAAQIWILNEAFCHMQTKHTPPSAGWVISVFQEMTNSKMQHAYRATYLSLSGLVLVERFKYTARRMIWNTNQPPWGVNVKHLCAV